MKLTENKVVMSRGELTKLLSPDPDVVDAALKLLRQKRAAPKRAKRASMKGAKRRNLRITDHELVKLLRVAPEFADRDTPHGRILNAWANHPDGATLSVEGLLTYLGFSPTGEPGHHPVLKVDNPIAWVRQTMKQAVLRGDAVRAQDFQPLKRPTGTSAKTEKKSQVTSDVTEPAPERQFGEGFGVGIQTNDITPLP